MIIQFLFNKARLFLVFAVVLFFGCLPAVAPNYPGGLTQEPTNLMPFENNESGIRMALPPGWKPKPLPPNSESALKAQFQKEGTSAILQVYCEGMFVNRYQLAIKLLNAITAATISNLRLWPDYSMGGGYLDPEFSAWTGMVSSGDQQIPMNFYIAWKLDSRLGGCKYGLFMVVGKHEASKVEGDFIAIVRSLK